MKLNIFSIPPDNANALKEKFDSVGLEPIHNGEQSGWATTFYFSKGEEPNPIPWVGTFAEFFGDRNFLNLIYFGAYMFEKNERCFVLTYGKSHFYVRPFCEYDFGIEMAKRIADENDIKQTASKKFAGKKKKEIKSYTSNTPLDIESGESVDYIQAAIADHARETFGATGKFGSSMLLNAPIEKADIGELLDGVELQLKAYPMFTLPRTIVVNEPAQILKYDLILLTAITGGEDVSEFTHTGHELVGVDFVFSGNERFTLSCRGHERRELGDADLDLATLRSYIKDEAIHENEIFSIRIQVDNEGQRTYSKPLKEALDFIVDDENVMLSQGHWVRFNEDYVNQLDTYIDGIAIEVTEDELQVITTTETIFNASEAVYKLGYIVADKDFSKIKTRLPTPIEAWDLQKGAVVYAVKFGTTQKLGYVCDQATAVLEILRSHANVKKLNRDWTTYCLWFGFKTNSVPTRISEPNSIILKQKIEAWARRCRELGIEPAIKMSLRQ